MSQHPSFGGSESIKGQRSVLKRYQKLESLNKKGLWKEEDGVLGLQKVKVLKIKAKKEKAAKEEGDKAEGQAADAGKDAAAKKS